MRKFKINNILSKITIVALLLFSASCTSVKPPSKPLSLGPCPLPTTVKEMKQNVYHTVAPGETLWRISQMYNVDEEMIKKVNKIFNVRDIEIGQKLIVPDASPRKDVVTLYPNSKWKYIIIHHSATDVGSSTQINNAHKNRGWEGGVGYHFVIDNGTCGKADGQIEATPRWIKQMDGAHCKANNMNERGIGICLVGNFSVEKVTPKQMRSLIFLVEKLRKFYKISNARILRHGKVRNAKTECPGRKFPWSEFLRQLKKG
ncbi:N-acetylmuramoyl-L-alanine amidase [Candidatus Omnitrophus magneticus]|uniref:N-acetylmuramoyl-L-alanine amidase n=1 Tax=Candidatus Omnitrophus magneticus TaxID=1609969 RepID=A0A0F0CIX0_9BACT|nr:N-acetylmuramoyl-L-alanine amidase [Candidatus Omnitrophus magneticus]